MFLTSMDRLQGPQTPSHPQQFSAIEINDSIIYIAPYGPSSRDVGGVGWGQVRAA